MSDSAPTSLPPRIEVRTEAESPRGWVYVVEVQREGFGVREHTVSLAWCDHDYWSGGRTPPSRVIRAVVEYAAVHAGRELPPKFDASTVRRWAPGLDAEVRELL